METAKISYSVRSTSFGPVAVLWTVINGSPKITRILLSKAGASTNQIVKTSFPDSKGSSCDDIDVVSDQIVAFLQGDDICFSLDSVHLDLCSDFQQKVLRAEHGIPRGWVSTYQRIASFLGKPSGSRAVGTALANNPFPIIIPCHRAIRSDGTLGGYQGGLKMKQAILEMEGIRFTDTRRIVEANLFY